MGKLIKYFFVSVLFLGSIAAAILIRFFPFVGAVGCPSCYDMESVAPRVIVDKAMPSTMRATLVTNVEAAKATEQSFYGTFDQQPYLVACSTEECDRQMGGRGAKATTLSMPFITLVRLSPRGMDKTILSHEFSHVEFHYRAGFLAQLLGSFPAWFDEGVAVLVSDDNRYLKPGVTASERCMRNSERPLPTSSSEWGAKAGKDPMLYADAVCRVLLWMEANGGKVGLSNVLASIAQGTSFTPPNGRQD